MPMTSLATIETTIKVKKFLTTVARQSIPVDVFETNSDRMVITGDSDAQIPQSIYIKLDAGIEKGTNTVQVPLMEELSSDETIGTTSQVGREENIGFRSFTMYYNNVSHAIVTGRYGVQANDYIPYIGENASSTMADLMSTFFKQIDGKYKRQALLETYSYNLKAAPTSLTPHLAPNWFVPKVSYANQPTWLDVNTGGTSTFTGTSKNVIDGNGTGLVESLADALTTRDGAVGDSSWGDVVFFQQLEDYARTQKCIKPVDLGDGTDGYIAIVPSTTILRLKDPTATSGVAKLGQLFVDGASFPPEMRMRFPGALGKIGGIILISDPRFPTITRAGADGSFDLTIAYAPIGKSTDLRDLAKLNGPTKSHVGFLLGAGALYEWNPEPFHWEYNYTEYDQQVGAGLFKGVGYQIPIFQKTGTADSAFNYGSICFPLANPA